jgi:hypothetical protein
MQNITIASFNGSGSSAIIDFFREFDGCGVALDKNKKGVMRAYEHFPFIASGGLFELGALVTNVNSAFSSDMMFNRFIDSVNRMNDNNFVSFGSYKWLTGDEFKKISDEFLNDLGIFDLDKKNCDHKIKTRFSLIICCLQLAAKIVYHKPVYRWGKKNVWDKKKPVFCMPNEDEFYIAARKYIDKYFEMCSQEDKSVMIYDQLICPQHTTLIPKYFNSETFKTIVVERDVRDMYFAGKNIYGKPPYGFNPLFPTDYDEFEKYWRANLNYKKDIPNVLVVNFEDLIYKYDETSKKLMDFVGLTEQQHIRKKEFLDPSKSINNTQSFRSSDEAFKESKEIEKRLKEFTYPFPYERKTNVKDMFDVTEEVKDK